MSDDLRDLVADLRRAEGKIAQRAATVVRKTASDIEATSKAFAPVDTGNLRNSISTDLDDDGLAAEIGPTAEYGAYVEYGTSRRGPAAYMGPALDRHANDFETALAQALDDLL